MTTRTRTGRPSKGPRHTFMARVPQPLADEMIADCEARDMAYSDFIAEVLALAKTAGLHERVSKPRMRDVPRQASLLGEAAGM